MFKTILAAALVASTSFAALANEGVSTFNLPAQSQTVEGRNAAVQPAPTDEIMVARQAQAQVSEGRNAAAVDYFGGSEVGVSR